MAATFRLISSFSRKTSLRRTTYDWIPTDNEASVKCASTSLTAALRSIGYDIVIQQRQFSAEGLPNHQVLTMPSLSPTMTQGNLVEWKKSEGDEVAAGDVICVIETDKATLDNESQEEGFLAKILIAAGAKDVPVGTAIAVLCESAESVPQFASYSPLSPAPASPSPPSQPSITPAAPPPPKTSSVPANGPGPSPVPHILGPSVRLLLQRFGLSALQLPATGPRGILTKGDVLAAVAKQGAAVSTGTKKDLAIEVPSPPVAAPSPASAPVPVPAAKGAEVLFQDTPNTQIRKVIASRLLESKWTLPHCYASQVAVLDAVLALRKRLKESGSTAPSVNDFVVKAVAKALEQVPRANAYLDPLSVAGDGISVHSSVDVCVAVATEKGLMTPIVKNANDKSLSAISQEIKDLASRARDGKLKPQEFMGGSFSVSNLGMFAVDRFCAIINPPQAGILAVGRGKTTAVWKDDPQGGGPAVATTLELTLSADARVISEETAGEGHLIL